MSVPPALKQSRLRCDSGISGMGCLGLAVDSMERTLKDGATTVLQSMQEEVMDVPTGLTGDPETGNAQCLLLAGFSCTPVVRFSSATVTPLDQQHESSDQQFDSVSNCDGDVAERIQRYVSRTSLSEQLDVID